MSLDYNKNNPHRILGRVRQSVSKILGLTRTKEKQLANNYTEKRVREGFPDAIGDKGNVLGRMRSDEITFRGLYQYFELVGFEEMELTIKLKHRDGSTVIVEDHAPIGREEAVGVRERQRLIMEQRKGENNEDK